MREDVRALLDTGATRTCLTKRLIAKLQLPPRRRMLVASAASYPERRMAYGFSLGLYHGDGRELFLFEGERTAPDFFDNDSFDVLLGMDVLSAGTLVFRPDQSFQFDF